MRYYLVVLKNQVTPHFRPVATCITTASLLCLFSIPEYCYNNTKNRDIKKAFLQNVLQKGFQIVENSIISVSTN